MQTGCHFLAGFWPLRCSLCCGRALASGCWRILPGCWRVRPQVHIHGDLSSKLAPWPVNGPGLRTCASRLTAGPRQVEAFFGSGPAMARHSKIRCCAWQSQPTFALDVSACEARYSRESGARLRSAFHAASDSSCASLRLPTSLTARTECSIIRRWRDLSNSVLGQSSFA